MDRDRAALQADEYAFPYHHLAHEPAVGRPRLGRAMRGGMEYLAYLQAVVDVVHKAGATSVLDVGCGDGRLLADLDSERMRLVGIDMDERAVDHARALVPAADVRVEPVAATTGEFDVVTCVETLEHIPDTDVGSFVAAVGARVRAGGLLVVTVPSTARPVIAKHYRHYDARTLRAALASLDGQWVEVRVGEIVALRSGLELLQRALSNRWWTIDVPALNRRILNAHRRPVPPSRRGTHVLAVLQRAS